MLRKILIALTGLILSLSLFFNYYLFRSARQNPIFLSSGSPEFYAKFGNSSLRFGGCLLRLDGKQGKANRSGYYDGRRYWAVKISNERDITSCSAVTAGQSEMGDNRVFVEQAEPCQVKSLDVDKETATISFREGIFAVNSGRVNWTSNTPGRYESYDLVNCEDSRLNWKLF